MQERQGSVFVVATANDVSALPPELLRKGRFDELFFVDLPTPTERAAILAATLTQHARPPDAVGDLAPVVAASEGWSGAELASLVPDALFAAFADGARALAVADLLAAARNVTPLSSTARERVAELRAWAKGRARPASTVADFGAAPRMRAVEIG
jgi:SpoVK/Ycf46/Vps4 family AAA+-type ATPase